MKAVCANTEIAQYDVVMWHAALFHCRVQSLQSLALQEATESNKPQVERELIILSAFCHHIYPTLQKGEEHPVSIQLLSLTLFSVLVTIAYIATFLYES